MFDDQDHILLIAVERDFGLEGKAGTYYIRELAK